MGQAPETITVYHDTKNVGDVRLALPRPQQVYECEDDAKAAAEIHFEALVLSCLEDGE